MYWISIEIAVSGSPIPNPVHFYCAFPPAESISSFSPLLTRGSSTRERRAREEEEEFPSKRRNARQLSNWAGSSFSPANERAAGGEKNAQNELSDSMEEEHAINEEKSLCVNVFWKLKMYHRKYNVKKYRDLFKCYWRRTCNQLVKTSCL